MIGAAFFVIIVIYLARWYSQKQKRLADFKMPVNTTQLLEENVSFYTGLDNAGKLVFEERIKDFLQSVRITGIGTTVTSLDQILIASGAIIVIFGFKDWKYNNISEILFYKDAFSEDYDTKSNNRNILGMVGDGALKQQMILSQASVHQSFSNAIDGHNTVIHEFAHLVDKADGATDGIPEYLLARPYLLPWVKQMHQTIQQMKHNESNDINFYGTTNDAEFFAVVSEYFFERPEALKNHHPELYGLLERMFHPAYPKT
ncbi:zinc-dependent peptidase [Parasediminibacterium sp. JCM 36343]|uniref:M90 family metallopeptidase n=1 Tax=Parasediminibacterium sp. JCM 36343 TaxID=3374279 RepID=UPI00397833B8